MIQVKCSLTAKGSLIGNNDTAIATGCVLVTNNTREFHRVGGLKYEDRAH